MLEDRSHPIASPTKSSKIVADVKECRTWAWTWCMTMGIDAGEANQRTPIKRPTPTTNGPMRASQKICASTGY